MPNRNPPTVPGLSRTVAAVLVGGLALSLAACTPEPRPEPVPEPVELSWQGEDRPFLEWAADLPAVLVVDRATRRLDLYEHGRRTREYPAVFGREAGRKVYEGDRRTPSGVYAVSQKRVHAKFHRFLDLDYPTPEDRRRHREALARGEIPPGRGRSSPGGLIGIHGSDEPLLNENDVDWTLGCVSLENEDVEDLYARVPVGALVVIRDAPGS